MRFPLLLITLAAGLVSNQAAAAASDVSLQPSGWDANVRLQEPADRNPDPKVLEIDLTARVAEVEVAPNTRVKAWTYDGLLPGPFIRAKVWVDTKDFLIRHCAQNNEPFFSGDLQQLKHQ